MKKYSADYYKNNGQSGDRMALGMYFRVFGNYLKQGKVLEFGAGNGFLSKRLATKYDSYAIEISDHAKKNISINSPKTKIVLNETLLESNFFDGIVSLHTFEHLEDPNKIIKQLSRSLKKGGVLMAVMPNPDGLGHKLKGESWFAYKDKTHISLLHANEWKQLLVKNNLDILITGSDWFWDPPYLKYWPNIVQKIIFWPGCLLMVILGKIIFGENLGEDLILVARKN